MLRSVTLDDLCLYCRVSGDAGQRLAQSLAEAHEEELASMNIPLTARNAERYALTVKAMTLHEMENPGAERPLGIQSMITGLRYGGR